MICNLEMLFRLQQEALLKVLIGVLYIMSKLKRFQYISKDGIKWSEWFTPFSDNEDPIQLKLSKLTLKNEYKEA